jgi:hypothetical protein
MSSASSQPSAQAEAEMNTQTKDQAPIQYPNQPSEMDGPAAQNPSEKVSEVVDAFAESHVTPSAAAAAATQPQAENPLEMDAELIDLFARTRVTPAAAATTEEERVVAWNLPQVDPELITMFATTRASLAAAKARLQALSARPPHYVLVLLRGAQDRLVLAEDLITASTHQVPGSAEEAADFAQLHEIRTAIAETILEEMYIALHEAVHDVRALYAETEEAEEGLRT